MLWYGRGWILVLGALLVSGCASGPITRTNHVDGELRGMVYDLDRQPLADALVVVSGKNRPSVVTDLHGRFGLGPVLFGPVTLTITKPGYESLKWDFRFIEGSQVLYLQLASVDQLFEKAALALEKKEWQSFQEYWDRGKALAPQSLQGYILGASALEQRDKGPEAIALLESFPTDRPVLAVELFLGDLYSSQGNRGQAVVHWKKALEIKDDATIRAKVE